MAATAALGDTGVAAQATYDFRDATNFGAEYDDLPSSILGARPKPRLTDEEKLARECLRRRQAELERRNRIFDAKRRVIGLDKEALDAQVAEMQDRRNMEKAFAKMGDNNMIAIDKQLKMLEVEKQRSRRQREVECKAYSLRHINFESRSEFDLNDPLAKRKGVPARVGDYDPRCGPSSMQKFSGEDLMKAERERQQRLAQVSFIEQQKFEKAMLAKRPDDGFALQVEEVTALRNQMDEQELSLRLEMQRTQHANNVSQAAENDERRQALVRATMEANEKELNFHASDKFLNECAPSHYNNRVIRDAYKGSSRDERMEVANQQRQQALDREMLKAAEDLDNRQFANTVEMTRKQLVALERDKQRRRREMREKMAQDNTSLRDEQKTNMKLTNQLYKNEFAPEFFEQFGRGCR